MKLQVVGREENILMAGLEAGYMERSHSQQWKTWLEWVKRLCSYRLRVKHGIREQAEAERQLGRLVPDTSRGKELAQGGGGNGVSLGALGKEKKGDRRCG